MSIYIRGLSFLVIFLTGCLQVCSQRTNPAFNKEFDQFRMQTGTLITKLKATGIRDTGNNKLEIPVKIAQECSTLKAHLVSLDTYGSLAINIAGYFDEGKRAAGQDSTSKVAQNQCTWYFFTDALRKAGTIKMQISALLDVDVWLSTGFPGSRYCPYYYAPVKVDFSR